MVQVSPSAQQPCGHQSAPASYVKLRRVDVFIGGPYWQARRIPKEREKQIRSEKHARAENHSSEPLTFLNSVIFGNVRLGEISLQFFGV